MNTVADPGLPAQPVVMIAGSPGFVAPAARVEDLPGPRGVPVFGNALQFEPGANHAVFERWARTYGPLFRFRFGKVTAIGVSEPTLMTALLRHRPVELARSPRISTLIEELGFRGLFTAEGERWRRQRRLVMRALTPEAIRHFFPVVHTVTERLLARWRAAAAEGRPANVPRDLKRYSIDVTTWLSMGVDVDTLNHDDNPLQGDVEFWFATIGRRLPMIVPYWRWFKLPVDRRVDAMVARLDETVAALIADARSRLAADPALRARPSNILEALVVARDEPGSEFDDEDVKGNVATMLFAGEDTTANAIAWLLYYLATVPEAAAKAVAEADAVLGSAPMPPQFSGLDHFAYVEAAAIEALRLKPIAPVNGMITNVPMDLAGLRLPRGQLVFLLPRPVAMDPRHFDQPTVFRPERWLGDAGESADDTKRKLIPFGGGPRYCPGRYLAMVEIRMVAAMVLRNFRIALDAAPEAIAEHYTFTLGPATLPLRFTPR